MSPYVYVGNNPIIYIDPDGRFRTKAGAWFFNWLAKGDGIDKVNGEWHSYKNIVMFEKSSGTYVFGQSRISKWSESTHTQNWGAPVFGLGTNETKATAKETGPGINIADDLLAVRPDAGSRNKSSGLGEVLGKFLSSIQGLLQQTKGPVADGVTVSKDNSSFKATSSRAQPDFEYGGFLTYDPETGTYGYTYIRDRKDSIRKRQNDPWNPNAEKETWWKVNTPKPESVP